MLSLWIPVIAFCQRKKNGAAYSNCDWTNMLLDKQYIPTTNDSCLLIVSTRNYNDTLKEFVDYDYDTTANLKYFAVYYCGNRWTAVPYPSLDQLLNVKKELKDLVIFTEGLGKTFNYGTDRATKLMLTYNVDVLFFDWPTNRPYMPSGKNIMATRKIVPEVAKSYALFLERFEIYKVSHADKFKTVTLFFHSMGNLLLMYNLKKDLFKKLSSKLADAVILNAACVPQSKHNVWLDKLTITENVYVTLNDEDRNLNGAKIIFLKKQLGEGLKTSFSTKVNYIDFSEVLDEEHNYYIIPSVLKQKPFLKAFYATIFEGKAPQLRYPASLVPKS